MAEKENTDELVVVDAKRYNKVKKALVESLAGDKNAVPPGSDEKESTRELVVVDVKRYKKVKKALEASEERYRQLFENVPIGIYRTTPDGRIIDSNPALVEMLGYDSFTELATRNLEKDPRHPKYARADFVKRLGRDGEIKGLESVWTRKDGSLLHIRENAKLVRNEEGQVFYEGTVEDITQGKLAEEAQRVRTQQIEILNCIITKGNLAESLTDMLEVILDCAIEALAFDTAGIFMYDPVAKKVNMLARRGAPTQFSQTDEYMSIEKLPFSQVLQRGQAVFLENTRKEHHEFYEKWGWRMAGSVPLVAKGRVVGALNVASCQRDAFSPVEKDILEMIGKEAGTLVSKLQTEAALRESEKYYRTLIDTSPDVIVVMDLNARLITVNQQFLKLGGYFYDEVIGASTYDFVNGLDRVFLEEKTAKFIENNEMSGSEYEFRKKDGQAVPLEVSASVLNDNAGQPKGIIAIGRDIRYRKRVEEALRQSENKYRELVENLNDVIFAVDAAGKIEYLSPAVTSMTGYTPEEVSGKNLFDFFSPEDRQRYGEQMQRTADSGSSVGEFLITVKDRSSKWVRASSRCVVENGKVVGIRGSMSDVTERIHAEHELLEAKALVDAVVDNTPLMIFLKEATDLRFVLFNRAGEELLGYDRKQLLGKNNLDLFPAEQADFFMAKDREVLDGATDVLDISEEPIMTAKKGQRLLHTRKVCIRGADGATKYLLGISEDITERKDAEAKLLAYQEQLRALTSELFLIEEKERRRIASELHDQIGQNLALCKLKVAALEIDMTHPQVKSELSAVRRLLECSIQDARSLIFDLSPPVLYELGFQAALEWLAERIEEQYHVPVEFENRAGEGALGNDLQVILFQVVRELLVNVGKHSRASQAKVILSQEDHFLKIQVNDDGMGFDASQIYDAKGHPGSYGFFSMRERLNYLGGGLEVRSRPGQGSQIVLTVPRDAAAKGEKP